MPYVWNAGAHTFDSLGMQGFQPKNNRARPSAGRFIEQRRHDIGVKPKRSADTSPISGKFRQSTAMAGYPGHIAR